LAEFAAQVSMTRPQSSYEVTLIVSR
jgi:hypothetical protein